MINLQQITVRNFFSYGNVPTTARLDAHKKTLIVGDNGAGKSVLFSDAICFALYGKPYRNVTRSQLVNSINLKGLLVELEFSIGPVHYLVRRGIKPNIFDIYRNGALLEQEAAVRDYQGYLETQILKINYKTFCQVVVMGSASYTAFMQLGTAQRREVIEDILDISVFSEMNSILKSRISDTKNEILLNNGKIESAKSAVMAQQKLIKVLEESRENRIQEETAYLAELKVEVSQLESHIATVDQKILAFQVFKVEGAPNYQEFRRVTKEIDKLESRIDDAEARFSKFNSLDGCPTCIQTVPHSHKGPILDELKRSIESWKSEKSGLVVLSDELQEHQMKSEKYSQGMAKFDQERRGLSEQINALQRQIAQKQTLIESISDNQGDLLGERDKLKELADSALSYVKLKARLTEEKSVQDAALVLLKDGGIKAAIIREYLPILNKLINKYLSMFGFDVNFNLDEGFNETIKSRGRDEFTYDSFSEGEKKKIDVSILFAFRQVSEMKNSASCNLLMCDEVAESSLDVDSKEVFLEILDGLQGGNSFVISHTAPDWDCYDAVIRVQKRGDFSAFEYID